MDPFIRQHAVTRSEDRRIFLHGEDLRTFYVGAPGADIMLRIYDKSAEIDHNKKLWFLPLWGLEVNQNVWRTEFQLRRPLLKSCGINTLDDLLERRCDLWTYLTGDWFSLRLSDNENTTRRTVHPLWQLVQSTAARFCVSREPVKRK